MIVGVGNDCWGGSQRTLERTSNGKRQDDSTESDAEKGEREAAVDNGVKDHSSPDSTKQANGRR